MKRSLACRKVLARSIGRLLQRWRGYRNDLEDAAISRADPLATYFLGETVTRPRAQRAITLGLALLSTRENWEGILERPMNRTVRLHLKSLRPNDPDPDAPVFLGGSSRPNNRFRELCTLAGISHKRDIESGAERPWVLKDLRKTCATYYDEHVPESSVEILGHSAGGITYRHYAHRAPLAFKAILSLPQPTAFKTLARGFEGQCPCCRRTFAEAHS